MVTGIGSTPVEILTTGAVTYDGTPIWIEFFSGYVKPSAGSGQFQLLIYDGSSAVCQLMTIEGLGGAVKMPIYGKLRVDNSIGGTFPAGSHTFRILAALTGGGSGAEVWGGYGVVGQIPPAFMRITKA